MKSTSTMSMNKGLPMRRRTTLLLLFCALFYAAPSWAAIGSSPKKSATCTNTVTPMTCTFTGGVDAGDFLWLGSGVRSGSITLTSVSDSLNGAWTCDAEAQIGNGGAGTEAAGCYFLNSAASGSDVTVTVNYSGNNTVYGHIVSWAGVATSAAKDDFAEQNSDTASPWVNGSITTTGPALILAVTVLNATITTPVQDDGFTALSTAARAHFHYKVETGAVTTTGTWSDSGTGSLSASVIMSFKEAAGGVGGLQPGSLATTGVGR